MSYGVLNSIFLGLAFWFFVVAFVAIGIQMRDRAKRLGESSSTQGSAGILGRGRSDLAQSRRPNLIWKYAATLIVLLVFTAVFDNVIVGLGIVAYDPTKISGLYIGVVPIEDFAYSVAAVLLLPTLWGVLGHLGRKK